MKHTLNLTAVAVFYTGLAAALLLPLTVFARADSPPPPSTTKQAIRSEAGLKIPEWGISVDAVYDPRLDELVEGHKLINILLTNSGSQPITLDVRSDRWIVVDSSGRKHTADNHVSFFNRKAWAEMDPAMKSKIDYPPYVKPGNSTNIDVFLPLDVDLKNFKEIIWRSASLGKEFTIYTSVSDSIKVSSDDKNFTLPPDQPKQWNRSMDDKSRDEILNPQDYPTQPTVVREPGSVPGSDYNTVEPTVTTAPTPINGTKTDLDPSFDDLDDLIIIR